VKGKSKGKRQKSKGKNGDGWRVAQAFLPVCGQPPKIPSQPGPRLGSEIFDFCLLPFDFLFCGLPGCARWVQ
jgi:hypothetical protein